MAAFTSDRTAGCSPADDANALGARGAESGAQLLANKTRMWLVIGTWLSVAIGAFAVHTRRRTAFGRRGGIDRLSGAGRRRVHYRDEYAVAADANMAAWSKPRVSGSNRTTLKELVDRRER